VDTDFHTDFSDARADLPDVDTDFPDVHADFSDARADLPDVDTHFPDVHTDFPDVHTDSQARSRIPAQQRRRPISRTTSYTSGKS
jgi:hypothetical protein